MKKIFIALFLVSAVFVTLTATGLIGIKARHRPNVILVMIDTLRADHLGAYGYPRATSPFIDQFAKENVTAKRAISVAPWTPPAVASILTGLSVLNHKNSPNLMETHAKKLGQQLSGDIDTLAEILKQNDYKTAAVSSNPWISPAFNFNQGFDHFFYQKHSSTDTILNAARQNVDLFLSEKTKGFFLYIHILDPHGPRTPSAEYAAMFSGKVEGSWPYSDEMQQDLNLYDAEIRSVDDRLKVFFDYLKQNNLYQDSVVVIVSDHGEQFDEHGQKGHGKNLHIEELHVPFLVKCPGKTQQATEISETVSNLDVTPTILDCAGIKGNWQFDGLSIFDSQAVSARSGIFSSVNRAFVEEAFSTKDGLRIINSKGRAKKPDQNWNLKGMFDLNKDRLEANPLADSSLQAELNSYLESSKAELKRDMNIRTESKSMADDSVQQLESLGYIND